MYAEQGGAEAPAGEDAADDNVVDAEFEEVKDDADSSSDDDNSKDA